MDYLINLANVLYLVAYFMRDIRRLRAFTILASGMLAAYFYFRPEPLLAAVYWNLFFGGLNAYHLARPGSDAPAPLEPSAEAFEVTQVGVRQFLQIVDTGRVGPAQRAREHRGEMRLNLLQRGCVDRPIQPVAKERTEVVREAVRKDAFALDQSGVAVGGLLGCAAPIHERHCTPALL